METALQILMERDDLSREEAQELIQETRNEILDEQDLGDYTSAEDIILDNLGLEMDYFEEIMGL